MSVFMMTLTNPMFYVYTYFDPLKDEPIYVGMGQKFRFLDHLTRKDRHPLTHRIQKMKRLGIRPSIQISDFFSTAGAAKIWEKVLIQEFGRKDQGLGPLLNLTDGGDGMHNPSPETRKKIGDANRGRKRSPETLNRLSQAKKNPSQATREKMSLAKKGKPRGHQIILSEESRQKISEGNKGKTVAPEVREKISKTSMGKKLSSEAKQKLSVSHLGKKFSDDHRKNLSESRKGRPWSEERRAAEAAKKNPGNHIALNKGMI